MNKQENIKSQIVVAGSTNKKKEPNTIIELRSAEVQELMNKPPSAILKSGISVILFLVISFFVSSFYVVYPERMTIMAELLPSAEIEYINSLSDGYLLWVIDSMKTKVAKGDTLIKMIQFTSDTVCIVNQTDGYAYKMDVLEKNMNIKSGQQLFCISRNIDDYKKHEVNGIIYLPRDSASFLKQGQVFELNYKGSSYLFFIKDFGRIANSDGRYPIKITYVDSLGIFNSIQSEICIAQASISNQTVFQRFFARQLNFKNKYKLK